MNFSFSLFNRNSSIENLTSQTFDLLIIGGGITGAGIALDAISRGLKTALIEKEDFAFGTSSRSTKLIHGGLRYLKNFEFQLVREVGTERAIVYKNAPHLVIPEKMLLPLVQGGNYGRWASSFGLWVYDVLAGVKKEDRRKMLSKKQTLEKEPLLNPNLLKGGGYYAEYRTDDARLTIEIIKTAAKMGSFCLNYAEAKDFIYQEKKIKGLYFEDSISDMVYQITAKQIVNATGPWVDSLRKSDQSLTGKRLQLTKGVHLVVPHSKFPVRQSLYFDIPDGRMIFAIPRGSITYFGTTDTSYEGNTDKPQTNSADVNYLLHAVNTVFPSIQLNITDILSSWAGLRPLIHQEGKSPSELSRKDEIFISESGLISIAGGKLTGYRKMAQKVTDLVCTNLGNTKKCKTKHIILNGGEFAKAEQVKYYIAEIYSKIKSYGFDISKAEYLVRTFGKQTDTILEKFKELILGEENRADLSEINLARAELWFCVQQEMVISLADYFVRRSGRLYFEIQSIDMLLNPLLADMKNYFDWNEEKYQTEKEKIFELIRQSKTFS